MSYIPPIDEIIMIVMTLSVIGLDSSPNISLVTCNDYVHHGKTKGTERNFTIHIMKGIINCTLFITRLKFKFDNQKLTHVCSYYNL